MLGANGLDSFLSFGFSKAPTICSSLNRLLFMFYFHFVAKLHFCHVHLSGVRSIKEFCLEEFIFEQRFNPWNSALGMLKVDQAMPTQELLKESASLKHMVADKILGRKC